MQASTAAMGAVKMDIRHLSGMSYKAIEMEHEVRVPMSAVLRQFADYLERNNIQGLLTGVDTNSHPDDEDLFLTTLLWAEF